MNKIIFDKIFFFPSYIRVKLVCSLLTSFPYLCETVCSLGPSHFQADLSHHFSCSVILVKAGWKFTCQPTLEAEAMAPHSSTLAWKIPWTEEPGWLQSMGSLRVRHDWETSLSLFTFMHWRRKWQPTPVFLPGESQGQGSLVGCRLWGRTESDTTEET